MATRSVSAETLGDRIEHAIEGRTASEIFSSPDDLKFRSSMTLFAHATADNEPFRLALGRYYGGKEDPLTLEALEG